MDSIFINTLSNAVFVYGSDFNGSTNSGAAMFAHKYYGAQQGIGDGPNGQSYALPIKNEASRNLSLQDINYNVRNFIAYAKERRDLFFMVTRIGCGVGGYDDNTIAPMFNKVPDNVWLPGKWLMLLNHLDRARLIVEGSEEYTDTSHIEHVLNNDTKFWNRKFEIVTSDKSNVSKIASSWCRRNELPWTPIVSNPDKFGNDAEKVRNLQMSWYATHLIAYHDNLDANTEHIIKCANNEGLRTKICNIMNATQKMEFVG